MSSPNCNQMITNIKPSNSGRVTARTRRFPELQMSMRKMAKWVISSCMVLGAIVLLITVNTKDNLKEYDVVNYETIHDLFSHVADDYLEQIIRDKGQEASPQREWIRCINSENGEFFDMEIPGAMLKSFYGRLRYGVIWFEADALYFRELDHSYEQERKSEAAGKNTIRIEWRDFEHWLSDLTQEEDEYQWNIWLLISDECKPARYWKYMKLFFTQYPLRWWLTVDLPRPN